MKYSYLGKSGLKVSQLCLGTMNFGPETEEKEAFRIMDAALDAGINFFDTANVYGGQERRGWTEEIIGRWFQQGADGARRLCWPPRCTMTCSTSRTDPIPDPACPLIRSDGISKAH